MTSGLTRTRTGMFIERTSVIENGGWSRMGNTTDPPIAAYVDDSNRLTVQVFRTPAADGTPWEGSLRVALRWFKDSNPEASTDIVRNWTWFQKVKDELWPDRIAIEIFPPTDKVVDVAPIRWLWVLPGGAALPFNLADEYGLLRS